MSAPLIGIPCYATHHAKSQRPLYANNRAYAQAVVWAGGIPLFIPPQDDDALDDICATLCERLDGLLLSGGADIDPAFYGEERLPVCEETEPERDRLELALTRQALAQGTPIFGICRGMQLLNVACGGALYQDLPTQAPESQRHTWGDKDHSRDYRAHSIEVAPGSRLAALLGAHAHSVNSLHHQAVSRPGDGLAITAWAPDGVAEGLELRDHPYALAVQFHPEELAPTDPASHALFVAFVEACARK
ncbi:MAG TPA: gamma-glutamyl-gamma-aminobutyrate hydrolase family protein [Ktedonobacterales bacterium]|nr:gamma-glutamyl-gamma-aminobutyrate hydrolase family protein [Ktedonobacterales bacterium]